jgi:hypothetical protein
MFGDAGCNEQVLAAVVSHFRAWLEPRLTDIRVSDLCYPTATSSLPASD